MEVHGSTTSIKNKGKGPTTGSTEPDVIRYSPHLVGVTASGPIYIGQRQFALIPIASIFATLQELAARVDNPKAKVTASISNRVSGDDAYSAWLEISTSAAAQLTAVTLGGRLKFLRLLLSYVARVGRVDGLEPLLTTAVNAAWPAMSSQTLSNTLTLASIKLRKSKFAEKHPIPVLDVNRRVAGLFDAGELTKIDLEQWRVERDLAVDGYDNGYLPEGIGGKLNNALKSPLERAIDQLFGGSDNESLEDVAAGLRPGGDTKGVPGGLPSTGDLPGQEDKPNSGSQSLDDIAAGLSPNSGKKGVPGGLPSLGDLPGQKGAGHDDDFGIAPSLGRSKTNVDDLLGSIPGSEYGGISGFLKKHGTSGFKTGIFEGATPGGPFAPPGQLPADGSGGEERDTAKFDSAASNLGTALVAVGGLMVALGPGPVKMAGVAVVGAGAGIFLGLAIAQAIDAAHEPNKPAPPKEKPHNGDLYPDPVGGGGGTPNTMPDYDGHGGGTPNTMPDYDGHGGGTPNTIFGKPDNAASIWDENFGGSGPTVRPQSFSVTALIGPGLMADVVQIGRSSIRY